MGLGFEARMGVISASVEGEESLKHKSAPLSDAWEIDPLNPLHKQGS